MESHGKEIQGETVYNLEEREKMCWKKVDWKGKEQRRREEELIKWKRGRQYDRKEGTVQKEVENMIEERRRWMTVKRDYE